MKTLVFTTTSQDKVNRLKMLTQGLDLEILSLHDVFAIVPSEPEETGSTELENAKIKAYHYNNFIPVGMNCLVLAQDDGIYTPEIPLIYQAGKDIKNTVKLHMGNDTQEDIYKYWKIIARKFNSPRAIFKWNFALLNRKTEEIRTTQCHIEGHLDPIGSKKAVNIENGAPISSLTLMNLISGQKFFSELTDEDFQLIAEEKCRSLLDLLS
ncbi:MAG: non-canonical purine NTP pyrophosphatase [Patescibacteria group bacterium]